MELIASAYDGDENGNRNGLNKWLRFHFWSHDEATLIFADIDPGSVTYSFNSARTFRGETVLETDGGGNLIDIGYGDECIYLGEDDLQRLKWRCSDLKRFLVEKDKASPKEWIDMAICKKIDIPWLEWAKKRGLVEQVDAPDVPTSTNRAHISDKLAILNQAAFKFWANVDRDDRETHPTNKKVIAWLEVQPGYSTALADKAATIIRPEWTRTGRKPDK